MINRVSGHYSMCKFFDSWNFFVHFLIIRENNKDNCLWSAYTLTILGGISKYNFVQYTILQCRFVWFIMGNNSSKVVVLFILRILCYEFLEIPPCKMDCLRKDKEKGR